MRWSALVFAAACYAPQIQTGSPCVSDRDCPSTLVCSPASSTCELVAVDASADLVIDAPIDAALGPFSAPVRVVELAAGAEDDDVTLTGDQLEIFFESARGGGPNGPNIWRSTRSSTSEPWSSPSLVTELATAAADSSPEISSDGLTLYFCSDRPGGQGFDIYRTTRADRSTPWEPPVRVVELSVGGIDCAPVESSDGLEVIFHRGNQPDRDLYRAIRSDPTAAWQTPTLVTELRTGNDDGSPFLASNDRELVFNQGPASNGSIVIATRPTRAEPFAAPTPIAEINSPDNEADPWLSPDGRTIYFVSDRGGNFDIYMATR